MVADLFYTPTSCGAASFICAVKAGIVGSKVNAHEVALSTHTIATGPRKGADFYAVNPKGNVPTVVTDDNVVLNENAATLQWVADQNPAAELAPANGTSARYLLQSKLSYISSEVQGAAGPLLNASLPADIREFFLTRLKSKYEFLSKTELAGDRPYLLGNTFTIADAYLYIILTWHTKIGVDLAAYPVLERYMNTIGSLDFVKQSKELMANAK